MSLRFVVIPRGMEHPVAVFADLDEARRWAALRYGVGAFRIDEVALRAMTPTQAAACA
jgi:hypothetical protein